MYFPQYDEPKHQLYFAAEFHYLNIEIFEIFTAWLILQKTISGKHQGPQMPKLEI